MIWVVLSLAALWVIVSLVGWILYFLFLVVFRMPVWLWQEWREKRRERQRI